jgi:hypothetical protein
MSGILEATPIILTEAERAELEGLARSTKTEHRLRQRARIVLAAADGMASRASAARSVARPARLRSGVAGLDETGNRGAEPKYTAQTGKRILALLDQPPPARIDSGSTSISAPVWADIIFKPQLIWVVRIDRVLGRRTTSAAFWRSLAALAEAISVSPMEDLEMRIAALEQEVWAGSKPPRTHKESKPGQNV